MTNKEQYSVLLALCVATKLKTEFCGLTQEYTEVLATQANIKKVKHLAYSAKYAGLHLCIELRNYEKIYLKLWMETNSEEARRKDYSLFGFEHDLDSLA